VLKRFITRKLKNDNKSSIFLQKKIVSGIYFSGKLMANSNSYLSIAKFSAIEIIPNLWLGNQDDAQSYFFLQEKKIQIVINCTPNSPFIQGEFSIEKKRLNISNSSSYHDNKKMYENFDYIVEYMYHALNQNRSILVHDFDGQQRAPTIIVAYLIHYARVSAEQAMQYLKTKAIHAFYPKANFGYALEQYDKDMKKKYT